MAQHGTLHTSTTTRWVIPATIDLHNWLDTHAATISAGYLSILGARAVDSATEAIYRHVVAGLPVDVPLNVGVSMVQQYTGWGQDLDEITVRAWRHSDGTWALALDANDPHVHETFAALDGPVPHADCPAWDELDSNQPWLTWHPHPTGGAITWAALTLLRSTAYAGWDTEEVEDILRFEALNVACAQIAAERCGGDEHLADALRDELIRVLWSPVDEAEDALTSPSGLLDPSWGELDATVSATASRLTLTAGELAGDEPVRFDQTTVAPLLNEARRAVEERWARACRNGR